MSNTPPTEVAALLGEQVQRAKLPEGTVVIFDRTINKSWDPLRMEAMPLPNGEFKVITYAALFVANRWFFTGQGELGRSKMKHLQFVERLSDDDISNIRVAGDFMPLAD